MTELRRVAVLRAGNVGLILYGLMGLISLPFLVIGGIAEGENGLSLILTVILLVILYAVMGFLGSMLFAALYNLTAKLGGGILLELYEVDTGPDYIAPGRDANIAP